MVFSKLNNHLGLSDCHFHKFGWVYIPISIYETRNPAEIYEGIIKGQTEFTPYLAVNLIPNIHKIILYFRNLVIEKKYSKENIWHVMKLHLNLIVYAIQLLRKRCKMRLECSNLCMGNKTSLCISTGNIYYLWRKRKHCRRYYIK